MFPANLLSRFFFLLITGLLAACSLYLLGDYSTVTARLFDSYTHSGKLAQFRGRLLTPERLMLLRLLLMGVAIVSAAGTAYFWKREAVIIAGLQKIVRYCRWLLTRIGAVWRKTSHVEKGMIVGMWLCLWITQWYVAFRLPFHVDERFAYLYFVSKGWLVTLAYYPGPNNHILFTLLCNITHFFIKDPFWVMKVSALMIGGTLPVVCWLLLRSQFRAEIAWLATALFAGSEKVFYYATQGRGYSLMTLFVRLAAFSIIKMTSRGICRKEWYGWFTVSSIFGFYTIPVFLYPFIGITLYMSVSLLRRKDFGQLFHWGAALMTVVGVTLLLYLPVLVLNGGKVVLGNAWVAPLPWSEFIRAFPAHLLSLAAGLWWIDSPVNVWLTIGVIGMALILAGRKDLSTVSPS